MRTNRKEAVRILPNVEEDISGGAASGSMWLPTPRTRRTASSLRASHVGSMSAVGTPATRDPPGLTDQVVLLNSSINGGDCHPSRSFDGGTRFGFSAPDDRLMSLSVPAEGIYGQSHSTLSFEIEFDQEEPDRITISLMDLDEDDFIRTVHKTVPFPARLVAELLSRRKATVEEVKAWKALVSEE